jgi:hypothetical protein
MYVPYVVSLDKYKHSTHVSTDISKSRFHMYQGWLHLRKTKTHYDSFQKFGSLRGWCRCLGICFTRSRYLSAFSPVVRMALIIVFSSDSRTNGSKEQQATREPRLGRPYIRVHFPTTKGLVE